MSYRVEIYRREKKDKERNGGRKRQQNFNGGEGMERDAE
jgi:hypothetical protein